VRFLSLLSIVLLLDGGVLAMYVILRRTCRFEKLRLLGLFLKVRKKMLRGGDEIFWIDGECNEDPVFRRMRYRFEVPFVS
jgi:hypothetical protein